MKSPVVILAIAALFMPAAFAQPKISKLQNVFSSILPGMPNYGIAQGSIFDILGTGLATTTSPPQGFPLRTVLNGVSVSITVNTTTTHAILYYVSATEILAILPSATPTGTGQIKVTLNGKISAPAAITVVQSAFGMLTLNAVGNGPAAVFDVNSQYLGLTNAANPEDVITLWGSGVGPVTGDETTFQAAQNLTDIPIEVDIGGKSAIVQYAGRGYYPGLDVINVQVPTGVSGCKVSVVVRSGDIVSNFGTIPVATSGRTCSEPVAGLTANRIQTLLSQPVINRGLINFTGDAAGSSVGVTFSRFTNSQYATKQPMASTVSFGDCTVINFTNQNMAVPNPIKPVFLDAGPSISFTTTGETSAGNASMPFQDGGYSASSLPAANSFKGTYTFTGSGGPDIGAFSASVALPGGGMSYTTSTLNNVTSVTRSQGLTVTWTPPGNPDSDLIFIQISGYAFVPNAPYGAEFVCNVPLAARRFTIPPAVLLALPPQPSGPAAGQSFLEVDLIITKPFTAPGADVGTITWVGPSIEPFNYQ
ncbi:MAG: hypothetical protein LAO55_26905 [Acidobacteriia bacterium]|nr:hypothetical protein [Terriglobia bacterium]